MGFVWLFTALISTSDAGRERGIQYPNGMELLNNAG
jgi:hypothetical protein